MLKLRLQRRGKKNYATYRVVVAEASAPVKGRFIADVGHYNPHTDVFKVDNEAVTDWIGKGAQVTPTVHNLLVDNKVISESKVTSWRPKKKDEEETQEAAGSDETKSKEATDSTEATTEKEETENNG